MTGELTRATTREVSNLEARRAWSPSSGLVLSVAWALAACETQGPGGEPTAKPTATQVSSVAPSGAASAVKPAPESVRYAGTVVLKKQDIGLDPGVKVREWSTDDGKQYQGDCKLEVVLHEGGDVKGALKGCELELELRGAHEERVATGTLEGRTTSFAGTLHASLAEQDGKPRLKGELWIANGDATIARKGAFDLPAL